MENELLQSVIDLQATQTKTIKELMECIKLLTERLLALEAK